MNKGTTLLQQPTVLGFWIFAVTLTPRAFLQPTAAGEAAPPRFGLVLPRSEHRSAVQSVHAYCSRRPLSSALQPAARTSVG